MAAYTIKHVDAFTNRSFEGNPAGVVLDARGLRDEMMQKIARELNLSETAFILPATRKDSDLRIRWFTAREEVPLCGHATIAGFHALAEDGLAGMSTNGQHYFRLETKSGILRVKVEKNFKGTSIEFELPVPKFKKLKNVPASLLKGFGLVPADLQKTLPAVKDMYAYIPVRSLAVLRKLKPNPSLLSVVCRKLRVLGISLYTTQTVDPGSAVHSRFFAPAVGVDEDPVTGSAIGPLGALIDLAGIGVTGKIPCRELPDGRREYIGEQGDEIGRRGRMLIRVERKNGSIKRVSIVGEAITVYTATLQL
jgi:trans-2,3-dihydro-3-hydroxyanthranilate isomerase